MRLNPLFSDHMVLQAGRPIHIFGAGPGRARVSLNGFEAAVESREASWDVILPSQSPGGPYTLNITLDGQDISLRDVYIGDVYLLAGQSNLQFKLNESATPRDAWSDRPLLRCFSLARPEEGEPFSPADGWQVCSRENAGSFSAIGYHLGALCEGQRAVGLINCYQGASVIESWLPEDTAARPEFALPLSEKHIDHTWPAYEAWNGNGSLYRSMFSQVPPFRLAAVVWYQGESDTTVAEARIYDRELSALIKRWRADLHDDALPFIIVQIHDYDARADEGWRALQIAQARAAEAIPHTYLIKSADVCETDCIHPPNKERLADRISSVLRALRWDPQKQRV